MLYEDLISWLHNFFFFFFHLNPFAIFIRPILSTICSSNAGEADEGEYATLKTTTQLQISEYDEVINIQRLQRQRDNGYDDTSEEGKLLECVQSETVTYASTRDLEPPQSASIYTQERYVVSSEHHMMGPMAPVTVQVHSEHQVSFLFRRILLEMKLKSILCVLHRCRRLDF